mmetsp:Transcript_31227/g.34975  ORF Transcript_31227/g.34975 Transcript_31227/m.34975 type:complete len:246 (-) Transcript_31227:563-1300(-)
METDEPKTSPPSVPSMQEPRFCHLSFSLSHLYTYASPRFEESPVCGAPMTIMFPAAFNATELPKKSLSCSPSISLPRCSHSSPLQKNSNGSTTVDASITSSFGLTIIMQGTHCHRISRAIDGHCFTKQITGSFTQEISTSLNPVGTLPIKNSHLTLFGIQLVSIVKRCTDDNRGTGRIHGQPSTIGSKIILGLTSNRFSALRPFTLIRLPFKDSNLTKVNLLAIICVFSSVALGFTDTQNHAICT